MTKTPTSFRLGDLTERQLSQLAEQTGMNKTEIVSVAIDRMYQKEIKIYQYSVSLNPRTDETAPAPLAFLHSFDPEAVVEFYDTAPDGSEIYHVETRRDIGCQLDLADGVIGYSVSTSDYPQYARYANK